jgi:cyclohexa-1,5-dienecarbonyl-CoA hydratase
MTQFHVRVEQRGAVVEVVLDRPPLNVLDLGTLGTLHASLLALSGRDDWRVLALRSGIDGTFSAGADVADHARDRAPSMLAAMHAVVRALRALARPTIALVDGRCLGGGCELALACDLVIASPRATFGQPEIDLGCFPPVGAALLPRLAGRHASELVLLGRPVAAGDALRIGLVNRVVDDVDAEGRLWAQALAGKSASALAAAVRALRAGTDGTLDEALARNEQLYLDAIVPSADAEEGVRAFLEKRAPVWSGR